MEGQHKSARMHGRKNVAGGNCGQTARNESSRTSTKSARPMHGGVRNCFLLAVISATGGTVVVTPPVAFVHDSEGSGAVPLFGVCGYLVCNKAP
jgi:hypothetical protein